MSSSEPASAKIAAQYKNWVYPQPVEDLEQFVASGARIRGEPSGLWPKYWPHRHAKRPLDILIAGCGTVQAAFFAYHNRDCRFVGIDLSAESLARQAFLVRKHGLDNLVLLEKNILDVAELGRDFDLIVSTGVLHHMGDPDAGLRALAGCLRPEGVLDLMVYGKGLRVGVYMLQEAFRLLGLDQSAQSVEMVKAVIGALPAHHTANTYINSTKDMKFDAGIVDSFLNPVDRAYSVPEIYAFCENNGLAFMGWQEGFRYSLAARFAADHPIQSLAATLDARTEAHVCDLLTQSQGTHSFIAAHPDYVARTRVDIDTADWTTTIPVRHPSLTGPTVEGTTWVFAREGHRFFTSPELGGVLALIDGQRTLAEIETRAAAAGIAAPDTAHKFVHSAIAPMLVYGHVFALI
jgi:SAM-dependent methyltransferase